MAILKELKLKNIYLIIPAVFALLIVFFAAQEDEEIPELSIEQSSINLEVSIEKNKHSITSIIPYLKKDNLLFMAEKLTELGVNHLVFYKPNNIDQSLAKKDLTKLNNKILEVVIGGCKQSGINFLPQLEYYDSLSDVFMNSLTFKENSFACTFDLQAANKLTPDDLNTRGNYVFITGPESGFSNDERFVMVDKKISSRSLGVNTLRAETAPIIGATLFQSFLGNI